MTPIPNQISEPGSIRPERAYRLLPNGHKYRLPLADYVRIPAGESLRRQREGFYVSIGHNVRKLVAREDILAAADHITHGNSHDHLKTRGALTREQAILDRADTIDSLTE